MKSTLQKITIPVALLATILLSSCLSDAENQRPSRIQIGLEVNSVVDTLTAVEDTLIFESLRLVHGQSFIVRGQDSLLINLQAVQLRFDSTSFNPQALLATNFPQGTYQELNFRVPRAEQSNPRIDPIFFSTDGRRFTMVLEGVYNDSSFTYRSEREYEFPFTFNPDVTVPEFNENFLFLISTNLRSWFTPADGQGFLNPRVDENSSAINDNIEQSFSLRQVEEGDDL